MDTHVHILKMGHTHVLGIESSSVILIVRVITFVMKSLTAYDKINKTERYGLLLLLYIPL